MNSNASNPNPSMATSTAADSSGKKVRKPYTITKSRESWTEEEHDKFLEALQLFKDSYSVDAADSESRPKVLFESPKKWNDSTRTSPTPKTQGFTSLSTKGIKKWYGNLIHKQRAHFKALTTDIINSYSIVLLPLQASMGYPSSVNTLTPGYSPWDDASIMINPSLSKIMQPQDEFTNFHRSETDIASEGTPMISSSSLNGMGSPDMGKQGKQAPMLHGIPDFAEVYGFIGSVFDPDSKEHVNKLKEMDPINFETVLLLMRNLSFNLSSPDFEPLRTVLSTYDVNTKTVAVTAGMPTKKHADDISC